MADNIAQPVPFSDTPDSIERIIPQGLYHGPSTPFVPDPPIDFACLGIIGMPLIFASLRGTSFLRGDQESTSGMQDGRLVMDTISSTGTKIILRILVCAVICAAHVDYLPLRV